MENIPLKTQCPKKYFASFQYKIIFKLIFLTACNEPITPGNYEGILFERKELETIRTPVNIAVSYDKDKIGELKINHSNQTPSGKIVLKNLGQAKIELNIPFLGPNSFTLKKNKKESHPPEITCYDHRSTLHIKACAGTDQFRIEAYTPNNSSVYSLSGDLFPIRDPLLYEIPQDYTLGQAIRRALTQNIDSQVELEHLIQVKQSARSAYLNLLPHISLNSALLVASLSPYAAPAAAFDVAPFLLPNRWLLAKKISLEAEAQRDAFKIFRANRATELESMAYTHLHHSNTLQIILDSILRLSEIETLLYSSKNTIENKVPNLVDDASDRWFAYRQELSIDANQFKLSTQLIKQNLAEMMGLSNPNGLKLLKIEPETTSIQDMPYLNPQDTGTLGVARSLEMRQLDRLIQAAHYQKNALLFNFIDPFGDPQYNLGLNLIGQVQVSRSKIQELKLTQEKTRNTVLKNSYSAVENYNFALETYKNARELMNTRQRIFERTLEKLTLCSTERQMPCPPIGLIIQDFQRMTDANLEAEGYLMNFRINRSRIDRILLQGFYDQLSFQSNLALIP